MQCVGQKEEMETREKERERTDFLLATTLYIVYTNGSAEHLNLGSNFFTIEDVPIALCHILKSLTKKTELTSFKCK